MERIGVAFLSHPFSPRVFFGAGLSCLNFNARGCFFPRDDLDCCKHLTSSYRWMIFRLKRFLWDFIVATLPLRDWFQFEMAREWMDDYRFLIRKSIAMLLILFNRSIVQGNQKIHPAQSRIVTNKNIAERIKQQKSSAFLSTETCRIAHMVVWS